MKIASIAAITLTLPQLALAHGGHGRGESWTHHLVDGGMIALALAVVVGAFFWAKHKEAK